MTTLLGSKRWIAAIAAAGALVAVSGCSASDPGSGEPVASTSRTATEAPTASGSPSAEPTATATTAAPEPSATATPSTEPTTAPAGPASAPPPATPAATPSAAPEAPAPGATGTCTAAQLTGSVQDQLGGGAAGSVYRTLVLTNASNQACTVAGYPGVSSVDGSGSQIGAPADRDGAAFVSLVLAPGASATATLQQTNAQNYGAGCGLTPAAGLRVYPPGATDSLVLPQALPACSAASIVLMTVSPLQPIS